MLPLLQMESWIFQWLSHEVATSQGGFQQSYFEQDPTWSLASIFHREKTSKSEAAYSCLSVYLTPFIHPPPISFPPFLALSFSSLFPLLLLCLFFFLFMHSFIRHFLRAFQDRKHCSGHRKQLQVHHGSVGNSTFQGQIVPGFGDLLYLILKCLDWYCYYSFKYSEFINFKASVKWYVQYFSRAHIYSTH